MRRNVFDNCIKERKFRDLFIELEWNNSRGSIPIDIDEQEFTFNYVAEMRGFRVITCEVESIPPTAFCKRIDAKLRPSAQDYILIFYKSDSEHQKWVIPVRNTDKRDLVTIEYESAQKADFLFNKLEGLNFIHQRNITLPDVKASVQNVFAVNSEKITKDFFREFKTEHKAFLSMISGLEDHIADKDNRKKDWYTSVMLNRLMFCYFIQKKGFLDGDVDYLHSKLRWMQGIGRDQFFGSFYKGFLCCLFHDGLNSPRRQNDFLQKYGRIPYLNGGMFDEHQLEKEYAGIDIKDEAFERLFKFFDKWEWHLDTRLTASGKDINPDVLGYIFEQYINDRAAMGAYYTKEDITEYISKNCILPFLMDKVKKANAAYFNADGYVWTMLRQSGDRYIYDAVKKGYSADWKERIPDYIAEGIDTTRPNLLDRRARWNEKTSEEFALPTEIWRETVERLQRCESILQKIISGGITEINDFITYNLDIRQFVYDLLLNAQDSGFVESFYHAMQKVTILDPTCGSGAFLFAAMNILEPLYEVCIDRMEEWNSRNTNLFVLELDEIKRKYRSNRQYFIYKSIILRNLYGVDIMVEATEIAKLRLFLKMVAVVEVNMRADNMGLDPLPDIDFNIRCGNTLVGYATEEELERDLTWGDIFANEEFRERIEIEMDKAAMAFNQFKTVQFVQDEDIVAFKTAKKQLKDRLATLNEALNRRLYRAITSRDAQENLSEDSNYQDWEKSHQPFHWLAEFYEIIHGNGGFDVIIGNPPYVEYNKRDKQTGKSVSDLYKIRGYKTQVCGNLYAFVIERINQIISTEGKTGMIIPHSAICTDRMEPLCKILLKNGAWFSTYDTRPSTLFDGVDQRLLIYILGGVEVFSTTYNRWYGQNRLLLLPTIKYTKAVLSKQYMSVSKFSWEIEKSIFEKVTLCNLLGKNLVSQNGIPIYFHNAPRYFLRFAEKPPYFYSDKVGEQVSGHVKIISTASNEVFLRLIAVLNSSLFFWWFTIFSNCRDLVSREINSFCVPTFNMDPNLVLQLLADYEANAYRKETFYKSTGKVIYDEYYPSKSKPIIDKIDKVLAKHYGFTDEELDFIINYDIKYRMGDNLNEDE